MVDFKYIHEDVVAFLKKEGIKEEDLTHYNSDLYVGCKDHAQAVRVKNGGAWEVISSIFVPEDGGVSDGHPYCVDIGFAAMSLYVKNREDERARLRAKRDKQCS